MDEAETGPLGGTFMPLREWVGKIQNSRKIRHLSAGHPNGKKRYFEAAEARAWVADESAVAKTGGDLLG